MFFSVRVGLDLIADIKACFDLQLRALSLAVFQFHFNLHSVIYTLFFYSL